MRNSSGQRRWATVLLLAQLLGGAAGQRHDGDDLPNCYSADRGTGARQVPGRLLVPPTGCQALGDDNQQVRKQEHRRYAGAIRHLFEIKLTALCIYTGVDAVIID